MHTLHLLPSVAIQPNLELKTQPKQLLGSLPLVNALPAVVNWYKSVKHRILNVVTKHSSLLGPLIINDENEALYLR